MVRRFAIYNGNIHTLDPDQPHAEAVGIVEGRIIAVGSNSDVQSAVGLTAELIDLQGRTVVPGLIDAHLHFLALSQALSRVQLAGVSSIGEALERIAARAGETPPGQWITGRGWNYNFLSDNRWPTKDDLDRILPHQPAFFSSQDGHSVWVNSRALERAGVTRDTPDPHDGLIMRDADGAPTGILIENAMRPVWGAVPEPTADDLQVALRAGMREANRLGLTGAHSMESPEAFAALQRLRAARGLTVRIYESIPADLLDHAITLGIRTGYGDEWLRLGHLKIFSDGALGSRSALMLAPYEGEPDNVGIAVRSYENIRDLVRRAAEHGLATCTHAIGDKANRWLLDIHEEAKRDGLLDGLRPRIEHAQVLDLADIGRFAHIGIIPSMQPIHCTTDMFGIDRWWGDRGSGAYVFETLRRSGAVLAFGSDAPVDNLSPLAGIHAAVTRQNASGEPVEGWYPGERLASYDALYAYCWGAAYASGEETLKGTITPGKLGDLTVLSEDILTIPGAEILNTGVVATIVDGEVVYSDRL